MKKTLAILLALAMVFSTMTVAFAEGTISADAQACATLGMLQGEGTGVTADYTATTPTRLQAAIMFLRLKGFEDEALAYTGTENFADADQVKWAGGKAIMGYLKAHKELGWIGDQGKFNPYNDLTAQEYYKVMLEALGYKQNTTEVIGDFTWTGVIEFAAAHGLTKVATATNYTVNDLAIATIEALKANVKDSTTKTLAASLVEAGVLTADKAKAAGVFNPVATALQVTGITANNLKTMKIDLNQEIDPTTATATTVKVTKAGSSVVSNVYTTADNKSIIVEYTVVQSDSLAVAINGVKTEAGVTLKNYTATATAIDTTIPEITGATVVNQKQIEVFFNEPINYAAGAFQVLNDIKLDGIAVIAKVTPDNVRNSVMVEFPSALAAGAHTISLANMVDYAGYKALAKDYAVTVAEDTAKPEIVSAVVVNKATIDVTFNEKIETVGSFEVNGVAASAAPVANTNGTKYTLTGFTALDLGAIVEIKVAYVGQVDVAGNTVTTKQTYKFNVADDTALPTVTATISDTNKITLTFSKSMDAALGTIIVKDSDDTTLATLTQPWTFKDAPANTTLELSAIAAGVDDINPDNITVNVKGMKDGSIRANLLPETNLTLAAKDTKDPVVNANYFVVAGATAAEDTVTFYFDEAMDTATLNNLSNYVASTLGSLSVLTGAEVKSIAADGKSITIIVPGADAKATAGETFTVYALKDVNGNMLVTKTGIAKLTATTLAATAAETKDGLKIKVTFDTKVSSIDPSALKVQKAAVDYAVFVNAVLADDGMSATFTANKNLGTDMTGYTIVDNNITLVKNIYNSTLTSLGAGVAITDKVAPTVTVATGANAGEIKITFSEAVNATNLTTLSADLIIRDKNGAIVALDDDTDGDATGTNVVYVGGTPAVTNFTTIVFTGTTGENYTVELIARSVKDLATTPVVTKGLAATAVTAK